MGCSGSKDGSETTKKAGAYTEVGDHLKTAADIVDCPKWPEGTKSLVSKYTTPDVWNKCKDKKDKYGFTFREAIFSGAKNVDSGIGVYAGSHDSYTVFAPLLDKVIEDYHKHKKGDKHVSDMDSAHLNAPPFEGEDAAMI